MAKISKPKTDKIDEINAEETLEPTINSVEPEVEEEIIPFNVLAARAKKAAMKTRVVIINSADKRDNDTASTAYAACENQYFSIARIVPLNCEVELEQCLIDTLSDVEIMLQVDSVRDGVALGVSAPQMIKKYNIIYVK